MAYSSWMVMVVSGAHRVARPSAGRRSTRPLIVTRLQGRCPRRGGGELARDVPTEVAGMAQIYRHAVVYGTSARGDTPSAALSWIETPGRPSTSPERQRPDASDAPGRTIDGSFPLCRTVRVLLTAGAIGIGSRREASGLGVATPAVSATCRPWASCSVECPGPCAPHGRSVLAPTRSRRWRAMSRSAAADGSGPM